VNLNHVIINEKVDKKFAKYLHKEIPYPFTSKELYEKSIRIPIGRDWNSLATHHDMVIPKVVVRKGAMIDPIEEKKERTEKAEGRVGKNKRDKNLKRKFAGEQPKPKQKLKKTEKN